MLYTAAYAQQHGFIHAGIITTALDSACGYAAFSLMPEDAAVLTVEFKTNLIAPAHGDYFLFRARVVKPGRPSSSLRLFVESPLLLRAVIAVQNPFLMLMDVLNK
jgi:acyl-coenzyme A thioesterase PaaI-like protein